MPRCRTEVCRLPFAPVDEAWIGIMGTVSPSLHNPEICGSCHGVGGSHLPIDPFAYIQKKPTWRNTRRYSTTSAYSLPSPPARRGLALYLVVRQFHGTGADTFHRTHPTPTLYAAEWERQWALFHSSDIESDDCLWSLSARSRFAANWGGVFVWDCSGQESLVRSNGPIAFLAQGAYNGDVGKLRGVRLAACPTKLSDD